MQLDHGSVNFNVYYKICEFLDYYSEIYNLLYSRCFDTSRIDDLVK